MCIVINFSNTVVFEIVEKDFFDFFRDCGERFDGAGVNGRKEFKTVSAVFLENDRIFFVCCILRNSVKNVIFSVVFQRK